MRIRASGSRATAAVQYEVQNVVRQLQHILLRHPVHAAGRFRFDPRTHVLKLLACHNQIHGWSKTQKRSKVSSGSIQDELLLALTDVDVHNGMVAVAADYTCNEIVRTYRKLSSCTAPAAAAIHLSFAAAPRSTVPIMCHPAKTSCIGASAVDLRHSR